MFVLKVPEGARRVEKPGVSRDVSVESLSEEDQVEIWRSEEGGRRMEILSIQEAETGEQSGLSREISELVVPKGKVPERPKGKPRNRQYQLGNQVCGGGGKGGGNRIKKAIQANLARTGRSTSSPTWKGPNGGAIAHG